MRKEIHSREIKTQVWLLDNGNWEIESNLVDTKGYDTKVGLGKDLPAGDPLHQMKIVIEASAVGEICDITIQMPDTPFQYCPEVIRNFDQLKGEFMSKGWNQLLNERFSKAQGCRHLIDMLRNAATVLFQAMAYSRNLTPDDMSYWVNTCHAMREDGEVALFLQKQFVDVTGTGSA